MDLASITAALASANKGILAIDESLPTIKKRFDSIGVESTEQTRQAYRNLLLTAKGLENFISGVILFEETLNQHSLDGIPFANVLLEKGIMPGIKVDKGLVNYPFRGEKITQGLDGLQERLESYKALGATFCKWRAVYKIRDNTPSEAVSAVNAGRLALYAAICQEAGMVPIVEPEVLMDGHHSLQTCQEVTERVLERVFKTLAIHQVELKHIILKPSMVIHGSEGEKASIEAVGHATLDTLMKCVPQEVPSINFLSGGQSADEATAHLKAINQLAKEHAPKWQISFSYGRALQEDCLTTWGGQSSQMAEAQSKLIIRAKNNSEAMNG